MQKYELTILGICVILLGLLLLMVMTENATYDHYVQVLNESGCLAYIKTISPSAPISYTNFTYLPVP